jgi:short-subunit dehydrogenase
MDERLTYTLITGGSRGIGYALARECAERGMNLILVARKEEGLRSAAEKITEEFNVRVHTLSMDLRMQDGPRKVWDWCTAKGYRINILVNNAGKAGTTEFDSSVPGYSDERILLNTRALVLLTRYFLPELKTHPRAYLLNIGSLSAYYALPYKTVYAASKAFVLSFSRALREELSDSNVSVTVVNPNGVRTNKDTLERIDSHSKLTRRLFIIDAEDVARISIRAMLKGKGVIVPGFFNRILLWVSKFLPARFREKRSARILSREIL